MNGLKDNRKQREKTTVVPSTLIQLPKGMKNLESRIASNEITITVAPVAASRKRAMTSEGTTEKRRAVVKSCAQGKMRGQREVGGDGAGSVQKLKLKRMNAASHGPSNGSMSRERVTGSCETPPGPVEFSPEVKQLLSLDQNTLCEKLLSVPKPRRKFSLRQIVPDEAKNVDYYNKRKKNREAARKFRVQSRALDEARVQVILNLSRRVEDLEARKVALQRELQFYKDRVQACLSQSQDNQQSKQVTKKWGGNRKRN